MKRKQYLGGHTRTLEIDYSKGIKFNVDTGFIVFNEEELP